MITIKVEKIKSYQVCVFKNGYKSFRTKEYKDYIKEITPQISGLKRFTEGDLKATVHYKCKNRVVGDLENITKILIDILEEYGIFKNDKQITEMNLKKTFGYDENTIDIEIEKLWGVYA